MIERNIYEIIVVRHNDGEIIGDSKMVATSSEAAMAKTGIAQVCAEKNLTPDDVEYAILKLGSLRPVQEVTEAPVSKF